MAWLVAGIGVLWLGLVSSAFRRILAFLAAIAVVGGLLLAAWFKNEEDHRAQAAQAAKLRIPRANVELFDLRMGTDSSLVKLTGRVRNLDPRFTLTGVELRLRVQECQPPSTSADTTCDTVGDTTENIDLSVPPHQAREIDEYVSFSGIGSPRIARTWNYKVVSVSGESRP